MGLFDGIEKKIGVVSDLAYQQIEYYYGKELELWRPSKNDIYTELHNKDANNALTKVKDFVGVTQVDDLSLSDNFHQASFTEGFLITQNTDVRVGDVIIFRSAGGKIRWKVEKHLDIGYTTNMFVKFSLSNMN